MDQDLLKASPDLQHRYLMDTDPDYASAKPEHRAGYLKHLGIATVPGLEKLGGIAPGVSKPDSLHPVSSPLTSIKDQAGEFGNTLWNDVKDVGSAVAHPINTGSAIGDAVMHPQRTLDTMLNSQADKAAESFNKMRGEFKKGNFSKSILHGGAAAVGSVPIVGAPLGSIADDYAEGNVGKAGARALEAYVAPKIISGGAKMAVGAPGALRTATQDNPLRLAIKGFKLDDPHLLDRIPGVENEHLLQGLSDIRTHGGGGKGIEDALKSTKLANQANREAWQQWINNVGDTPVHGKSIVDATDKSLAKTLHPDTRKAILDEAKRIYDKNLTAPELEELLQQKNGELAPFYSKSAEARANAVQAGAKNGQSQALLEAQVKQIRDVLYNHLHPEEAGAGPRLLQQRYGAVKQLENAANALRLESEGAKPFNAIGGLGKKAAAIVNVPGRIWKGESEQAFSGVKNATRGDLDPLVERAIAAAPDATPFPVPQKASPQKLLGRGPLVTPPPENEAFGYSSPELARQGYENLSYTGEPLTGRMITEGSIKPAPPINEKFGNDFRVIDPQVPYPRPLPSDNRTLGPSSQVQIPGFVAAGGETPHKFPDTQDLVPWKNPQTGQIEYIPRRFAVNPPPEY